MEKGRFLVFRTLRNCLKILCFFFHLSKKYRQRNQFALSCCIYYFALSIFSVRFSKKVFYQAVGKIFPPVWFFKAWIVNLPR